MITNIIMIAKCKAIYIYIYIYIYMRFSKVYLCNNDKILIYIKLDKV